MPQAKVQSRGRVTIPAEVRDALGVQAGDELHFVQTRQGRFELRAEVRPAALLSARKARLEVQPRANSGQLKLPI